MKPRIVDPHTFTLQTDSQSAEALSSFLESAVMEIFLNHFSILLYTVILLQKFSTRLLMIFIQFIYTDSHSTRLLLPPTRCSSCEKSCRYAAAKHRKITRLFNELCIVCFPQALTTLNLAGNQVGAEGVECLAKALLQNTVTSLTYSTCYETPRPLFTTDTHDT